MIWQWRQKCLQFRNIFLFPDYGDCNVSRIDCRRTTSLHFIARGSPWVTQRSRNKQTRYNNWESMWPRTIYSTNVCRRGHATQFFAKLQELGSRRAQSIEQGTKEGDNCNAMTLLSSDHRKHFIGLIELRMGGKCTITSTAKWCGWTRSADALQLGKGPSWLRPLPLWVASSSEWNSLFCRISCIFYSFFRASLRHWWSRH